MDCQHSMQLLAVAREAASSPQQQLETAQQLLDRGADPNYDGGPFSGPVLYWAARDGCFELTKLLLAYGANPARCAEPYGWSPLMAAAWKHDDPRYAPLLLSAARTPEARTALLIAQDREGRSATFFALKSGHAKAAASLIALGADALEAAGRLPSSWWRKEGYGRCRRLLQEEARFACLVKLRAIADHSGPLCIRGNVIPGFSVLQDKGLAPPSVDFHGEAVARSEKEKKKGRRKRKRGKGDEEEEEGTTMRCEGAVLEHVCVTLPRDLWVELLALGWGVE